VVVGKVEGQGYIYLSKGLGADVGIAVTVEQFEMQNRGLKVVGYWRRPIR